MARQLGREMVVLMRRNASSTQMATAVADWFDQLIAAEHDPEKRAGHMLDLTSDALSFGAGLGQRRQDAQAASARVLPAVAMHALTSRAITTWGTGDCDRVYEALYAATGRGANVADLLADRLRQSQVQLDRIRRYAMDAWNGLTDQERGSLFPVLQAFTPERALAYYQAIMALRRYGIKPCYFRSQTEQGGNIVVNDPVALDDKIPLFGFSQAFTVLFHYSEGDIQGLLRSLETPSLYQGYEIPTPGYKPLFSLAIGNQGDVQLSAGLGLLPISAAFTGMLKQADDEQLLSRMMQHMMLDTLAQLVLPGVTVKSLVGDSPLTGVLHPTDIDWEAVLDLPHRRELQELREQEVESGRIERAEPRYQVPVVPHRTKLRPGAHASPQALSLAAKYHVQLEPDETFVGPSTRYKHLPERPGPPHRARRRRT